MIGLDWMFVRVDEGLRFLCESRFSTFVKICWKGRDVVNDMAVIRRRGRPRRRPGGDCSNRVL